MERIYLDHNATSPLRPEVREALGIWMGRTGNPNSIHSSGRKLRQALDDARESVAKLVGVSASEVIFTSGGTEANHLAWKAFQKKDVAIFTSPIEHSCIISAAKAAEKAGASVNWCAVAKDGSMNLRIPEGVDFISLQQANNETGVMYDAGLIEKKTAVLHMDAVQTIGKIPFSMKGTDVDMVSLSGHKLGAPQGVGALIRKKRTPLESLWEGGPQEKGMRPGTENVLGIIGLGVAATVLLVTREKESEKIKSLRDALEQGLTESLDGCEVTGKTLPRLPNTSHVMFEGVDAESLLIAADLAGIDCSTGAACASGSLEASHVLLSMGYSEEEAKSSIRFSLGWSTTEQEIEKVVECFPKLVDQVRSTRGWLKK